MSQKNFIKGLALMLSVLMLFALAGCDQAKDKAKTMESAGESVADAAKDAAESVKDAAEDAAESVKDQVGSQVDKLTDEVAKAKAEAAEKAAEILGKVRKSDFPLTVEDSAGRKVVIEQKVEKVVSLGPNMTETVFALGAGDRLVGRTDYCDYPAEVEKIESIGTLMEPNLEKIVELKPDLVLASTHVSEEFVEKLEEVGIPTLFLYDEHELDGLYEIFAILGQVLDLNQEAAELTADVFSRIEYVEELISEVKEPTVYYVVGFGEHGDYTAGDDTFLADLLDECGVKNIASDVEGWTFSVEKLIEADPEYILIPQWADGSFQETEPYKNLTAVKEGRVIVVDENIFNRQGPRVADAIEFLVEQIHPEAYQAYKKVA